MKKSKIVLVAILQLFFINYSFSVNDDFVINGNINAKYDGAIAKLHIPKNDSVALTLTDTVKDGKFHFNGKSFSDRLSHLIIHNSGENQINIYLTPILEAGEISINVNDTVPTLSKITGTYLNDEIHLYYDSLCKKQDYVAYIKRFFTKHSDDATGYKIFMQNIAINDFNLLEYYELLSERLQQLPEIKRKTTDFKKSVRTMEQLGKKVLDHSFVDESGKIKKISDFIGGSDYLYIDFWASWCGPCRAGIQELKKIYPKITDDGITVLGISLDTDTTVWKRALQEEKMMWKQLGVKSAEDTKIVRDKYNIVAIPFTLLLDKKGNVLDINLHPSLLESWMQNSKPL